jgi:CheY-like chemotaxis protein
MPKILILIADDQSEIREMMRVYLEIDGYRVIEAENGRIAVEKAAECSPNLILMDIAMPVLDGLEAVREIRQHDGIGAIPIVAISAYGEYYADRARAAGCNEVLHKPLDLDRLKPVIERYLANGSARIQAK